MTNQVKGLLIQWMSGLPEMRSFSLLFDLLGIFFTYFMTFYETIGLNNFIILQDYSNTSFDFIPCFDLYSLVRNPISINKFGAAFQL
jgi:hypothetical protein